MSAYAIAAGTHGAVPKLSTIIVVLKNANIRYSFRQLAPLTTYDSGVPPDSALLFHFQSDLVMKFSMHSHCAGSERVPPHILEEVIAAAEAVDVRIERGAAPRIRDQFVATLRLKGWSSEVTVSRGSDMSITSMRENIGLCLQTGNMARMYADLMKLQALYLNDAIQAAVFVLPAQPVALAIGDNIAQAARLERELEIFRKVFYVPTLIVALE